MQDETIIDLFDQLYNLRIAILQETGRVIERETVGFTSDYALIEDLRQVVEIAISATASAQGGAPPSSPVPVDATGGAA